LKKQKTETDHGLDKEIPEEKLSNPKISHEYVGLGFDKMVSRGV
jgi:hypothetical protein